MGRELHNIYGFDSKMKSHELALVIFKYLAKLANRKNAKSFLSPLEMAICENIETIFILLIYF
jgi:hypothetical protein